MPYSFIIKTTGSGPRFSCYSSCYSLDYEPFYISNKRVQQKFSDQFHIKTSLLHLHKNWHKLPLCILLVLRLDLKNMLSFTSTSFFYFFAIYVIWLLRWKELLWICHGVVSFRGRCQHGSIICFKKCCVFHT